MTTTMTNSTPLDPASIFCDSCAKLLPLQKPYLSRLWNPNDAVFCRDNYEVCNASRPVSKKTVVGGEQVTTSKLAAVKDPLDGKWYRPAHFLINPEKTANLQQDSILRAETDRDMYAVAVMNASAMYDEAITNWRPTVVLNRYKTKYKIYWKQGGRAIGYYQYTIEPVKRHGFDRLLELNIMNDGIPTQKDIPIRGQLYVIPEERRKGYAIEMVKEFKNSMPADKYPILGSEDPTPEVRAILRKTGDLVGSGNRLEDWKHGRFRWVAFEILE
jgi:hypothetical protein